MSAGRYSIICNTFLPNCLLSGVFPWVGCIWCILYWGASQISHVRKKQVLCALKTSVEVCNTSILDKPPDAKDLGHLWLAYIRKVHKAGTQTKNSNSNSNSNLLFLGPRTCSFHGHFAMESVPDPLQNNRLLHRKLGGEIKKKNQNLIGKINLIQTQNLLKTCFSMMWFIISHWVGYKLYSTSLYNLGRFLPLFLKKTLHW